MQVLSSNDDDSSAETSASPEAPRVYAHLESGGRGGLGTASEGQGGFLQWEGFEDEYVAANAVSLGDGDRLMRGRTTEEASGEYLRTVSPREVECRINGQRRWAGGGVLTCRV